MKDLLQQTKAQAAVAIIELTSPRQFLLLRRNNNPGDHWSGHYAFPGGRADKRDDTLFTTAIRETKEETGLQLQREDLVKALMITPAGRSKKVPVPVQPFHFQLRKKPRLSLQKEEIQAAFWIDINEFCKPEGHAMREMVPERLPGRLFPSWPINDYYLWGFTYELVIRVFCNGDNLIANT